MNASGAGGKSAMPSAPPSSRGSVPTSAVLDRIEKELRALWTEPTKSGEAPKSRVCTMNLVVVAGSRELAERYTPILDDVTATTPARAILVALEPDSPVSALEGDVSAVCSLEGDGTSPAQPERGLHQPAGALCSERVRLIACGAVCARVASAIEALCVPEIPTALVWLGRLHTEDPVFLSLAEIANRIILDTEYTSLSSLVKLARWARAEPGRGEVADLAWTRLAPWQELCARFFDAPTMRAHASHITNLTLKQASDPGARLGSEGSLLLGWLATRLGWKASRIGGALRFKRPDGGTVAVKLGAVPRPAEVAPAALAYVSIEAESGGVVAKGTLERELGSGLEGQTADADVLAWKLDVAAPTAVEQRVRLGANKGAKLLDRTLHRPASDPLLAEAVAFAEQLVEDALTCA